MVLSNGVRPVVIWMFGRGNRVLERKDDCDVTEEGTVEEGEGEDGGEVESGDSDGVCSVDSLERRTEVL